MQIPKSLGDHGATIRRCEHSQPAESRPGVLGRYQSEHGQDARPPHGVMRSRSASPIRSIALLRIDEGSRISRSPTTFAHLTDNAIAEQSASSKPLESITCRSVEVRITGPTSSSTLDPLVMSSSPTSRRTGNPSPSVTGSNLRRGPAPSSAIRSRYRSDSRRATPTGPAAGARTRSPRSTCSSTPRVDRGNGHRGMLRSASTLSHRR